MTLMVYSASRRVTRLEALHAFRDSWLVPSADPHGNHDVDVGAPTAAT